MQKNSRNSCITKISVIICTFNRCVLLESALESMVRQDCEKDLFEVIVVDNASSDGTKAIFDKYSLYPNFFYIQEKKPGLSYARNTGYKRAKGKYVAYMDDDAKADKRWINNIFAFISRHPDIVAFGGPYKGYSLAEIPKWVKEGYGTWSLGDKERPIEQNEWINGTNMIFKRSLLEDFGGFNTKVGMSGTIISYGEETSLLLKIKAKNYPIFYVPDINVEHFIPEYKLSLKWMLKAHYINGFSALETFDLRKQPIKQCIITLYKWLKGFKKILFSKDKHFKTKILESFSEFMWNMGLTVKMFKE